MTPLLYSSTFIDFACAADPNSEMFFGVPSSRPTITRRMVELTAFLKCENASSIKKCFVLVLHNSETTDSSVTEELILYVCYIDLENAKFWVCFLSRVILTQIRFLMW